VIQVNLRVPAASQTGAAVPVLLRVGNSTSQFGLTLAIQSLVAKTPTPAR
jgi:uncharacterized protein (TIGR03437 family)